MSAEERIEFRKIRVPRFAQDVSLPDIRELLANTDVGDLFAGVRRHAEEAGVSIVVEGEGVLSQKLRDCLEASKENQNDGGTTAGPPGDVAAQE